MAGVAPEKKETINQEEMTEEERTKKTISGGGEEEILRLLREQGEKIGKTLREVEKMQEVITSHHPNKFCKETVEKCSHCGGPHVKNNCPDWLAGAAPTCCNCTTAKIEQNGHNAFSPECQVRRRWEALARAKVAYC
ncbi:hypothetical protein ACJJTC_018996 [Scirpophaga incertulas]